jgi:hypothetical protein
MAEAGKKDVIARQMKSDVVFLEQLRACEEWPSHCYMFRPNGLKDALFLLHGVATGEDWPSELELRKACALVYADHLRLERHYFYAEEAIHHTTEKLTEKELGRK